MVINWGTFPETGPLWTMEWERLSLPRARPGCLKGYLKGFEFVPATQQEIAKTLTEDFSLFEDWEERYRYIIELGNGLADLADTHRTESNRVQGCTSNAWLVAARDPQTGLITFSADSDSQIVRGLIAILLMLFSERLAAEILEFDVAPLFQELTLHQHLSPSRANGLNSLVRTLKERTLRYLEAAT